MFSVQHISPKNQFLSGISSGYDKISYKNEPQPITTPGLTSDCLSVDYGKECCNMPGTTFPGAEILNFSSTKPGVGLVLCARGFDTIKPDFEIETSINDKFWKYLLLIVNCKRHNDSTKIEK